uniref:Putative transmembrane transport n=1 Tax=Corethrella appendiculata TaxID=1370023 RepID=U5EWR5_9DIPT
MDSSKIRLIISAVGIFVCYFYYGILQEKITRGRYGDEIQEDGSKGERFSFALALVFVQCVCNWIFAKGMLVVKPQPEDKTPVIYYAISALTYLLAMVSSNMVLRWVSYPTQVVAKSAKPIPVMILGVILGRKTYPLRKYLLVLLIVIGVVLFMYKDDKKMDPSNHAIIGNVLLFLSLSMDGITGAVQERMRQAAAPSAQHMMLAMNGWSVIMLLISLVLTGELTQFAAFAKTYPILFSHLASLALAGALGQLFIFMMVSEFGPLACSVVTTTRKFFTVLFSVIFFGNALTGRQWIGTVLVFTGLFADMFMGKKSNEKLKPSGDVKS